MKYEIKNLKTFNGRDGGGFEATLYKDGKRIATVFNDGCGGCTRYHFIDGDMEYPVIKELQALAVIVDPSCDGYSEAHDIYIDHLIDCKENNKLAKNAVLFRKNPTDIFEMFQAKNTTEEAVRAKYPSAVVWSIAQQAWI
jgi:hypothetical protein